MANLARSLILLAVVAWAWSAPGATVTFTNLSAVPASLTLSVNGNAVVGPLPLAPGQGDQAVTPDGVGHSVWTSDTNSVSSYWQASGACALTYLGETVVSFESGAVGRSGALWWAGFGMGLVWGGTAWAFRMVRQAGNNHSYDL